MRSPRPFRPFSLPRPFSHLPNITGFSTMPGNNNNKEKKPPLTHFLCLPLVNSSSLPQLESSLSTFKAAIPPSPHQHANPRAPRQPLIPDGAIRPIGTLHLTLGVMSLPTRERLDEALEFFQSLDLTAMAREAEILARRPNRGKQAGIDDHAMQSTTTSATTVPQPFKISLESLHALPRVRAATVLHAAPVDASSRLYPFCEMLRDKFLEAGFLLGETKGSNKDKKKNNPQTQMEDTKQPNEQSTLPELPTKIAAEATEPKPVKPAKPRPLLLHATVVNTIYVKGRRGGSSNRGHGNRNHRTTRYAFDARDMLAHYRDYYLDSLRTQPRGAPVGLLASTAQTETSGEGEPGGEAQNDSSDVENEVDDSVDESHQEVARYPFLWAKDFPLESICICEMGAKKLDTENDPTGLNGRLREKYTVVSERSLDFITQRE